MRGAGEKMGTQHGSAIIELHGADSSRAALQRANLENTDLSGVVLDRCRPEGANLREAKLYNATLDHAGFDT